MWTASGIILRSFSLMLYILQLILCADSYGKRVLLPVNLEINREYPVINKNTLLQSQSQKINSQCCNAR